MKIVLIIVGVFVVLAAVGGFFVVRAAPEGFLSALNPEPPTTEVRTEIATHKSLIETISAPGEIEPLTKVEISSEVSARIEQLPFRDGDEVRRGDVLVKLDDRDLRAVRQSANARRDGERFRLQSEEARLVGLRTNLEFARKTLDRQQALYESGDKSRSDLDNAMERVQDLQAAINASTHSISVIESSLAAAEADIERAEDGLANAVIRTPIDGVVTQLNAEIGEVVLLGTMNNPGTVIMTIADLSRMLLNARVAESDVAKVAEGQKCNIHIKAYPDEVFPGVVRKISLQRTTALDGTGFFETEIEIELHGQRIRSGHNANVDIEVAEHTGIVVPMQAIVDRVVENLPQEIVRDNPLVDLTKKVTNVAYRMLDGKAVCTPVKPGASDWTHTLVLEGLNEGDVIVAGPFKVLDQLEHDQLLSVESEDDSDEDDAADAEPDAEADDEPDEESVEEPADGAPSATPPETTE